MLGVHRTMHINAHNLAAYKEECYRLGVKYGFGAKDPHPGSFPPTYHEIDCSGYVRTLLYYATGELIPDGSTVQHEWFKNNGFKKVPYSDTSRKDDVLRISFAAPTPKEPVGHVWLCAHDHTIESYGGCGPGERPAGTRILVYRETDTFEVGTLV
jgi:cell wall-associated NlpC family hydrolase